MGQKNSSTSTVLNNAISNVINSSVISNTQRCQNSLSLNQNMKFVCNPPESVALATTNRKADCIIKGGGDACNSIVACDYSNIKQDMNVSFTAGCKVDNEQVLKIQADIQSKLESKMKDSEDSIGKAVQQLASIGGSSSDTSNITNNITNNIKNSVTQNFVQEMLNQFSASQDIEATASSGIRVSGISQNMQLSITTDLASKNKTLQDTIAKLSNESTATVEKESKTFLTDLINGLANIVGGTTNAYIVTVIIVGVVFMFAIFIGYKFLGGEGVIDNVTDAAIKLNDGQSSIETKSMSGGFGNFNLTGIYNNMKMNKWSLLVVGALLVALYLYSSSDMTEGFSWYSDCIYNAENKLVCNPSFRPYNWMYQIPNRFVPSYDLRGDYAFSPRLGQYFRYPWNA